MPINPLDAIDNTAPAYNLKIGADHINAHWHPLFYAAKTVAYTVVLGDVQKLIDVTAGTFTLSLFDATTAGDGFWFDFRNSGTGVVTIDPFSAQLIDGVTTLAFGPGDSARIVCTGTQWRTVGRSSTSAAVRIFTRDMTLASGTQFPFTLPFTPTSAEFLAHHGGNGFSSWGFDDGTTKGAIWNNSGVSTHGLTTTGSIYLYTSSGNDYEGVVASFNPFTITWTKTGAATGTATIIAKLRR